METGFVPPTKTPQNPPMPPSTSSPDGEFEKSSPSFFIVRDIIGETDVEWSIWLTEGLWAAHQVDGRYTWFWSCCSGNTMQGGSECLHCTQLCDLDRLV